MPHFWVIKISAWEIDCNKNSWNAKIRSKEEEERYEHSFRSSRYLVDMRFVEWNQRRGSYCTKVRGNSKHTLTNNKYKQQYIHYSLARKMMAILRVNFFSRAALTCGSIKCSFWQFFSLLMNGILFLSFHFVSYDWLKLLKWLQDWSFSTSKRSANLSSSLF